MSVKIEKGDFEARARWIAWKYDLDEKEVEKALLRTKVSIRETTADNYFSYLEFEPSLERALHYLRPKLAIQIFNECDHDEISGLLKHLEKSAGRFIDQHQHSIEEQCRWEAESYMLPD